MAVTWLRASSRLGARVTLAVAVAGLTACLGPDEAAIPWHCLDVLDGRGDACERAEHCTWVAERPDERFP